LQIDIESKQVEGLKGSRTEKKFVSHPIIKQNSLEERTYQSELANIAIKGNTLAVLPTGLGKTAIALLVVAEFLKQGESQCLVLAPTRVLVHQHHRFLLEHLNVSPNDIGVLTGEDTIVERKEIWSKRVVCATPQVLLSDIRHKNCDLSKFSLVIFDEVHRAVGNHSYTSIAALYNDLTHGRVLGMTASLPSDKSKVDEIVAKLKIAKVEIRDEKSADVKPYVFKTDAEWIELTLSPPLKQIQKLMKEALDQRLKLLEDASLIKHNRYGSVGLKDLLRLRMKVSEIQSSQLRSSLFSSIRLLHALNLIETQSLGAFRSFMERLYARRRGYGMGELLDDPRVILAYQKTNDAVTSGVEHPKISEVINLVEKLKPGDKAIVFASYRDSVDQIYSELIKHGFKAGYLIGKSGQSGQSQKKQIRALEALREGEYDILVATQVGEEGLDVAECNLVVFYDNVPSAVRFVQRKGRTGRKKEGRICVLLTKGTRDEAYYWLARRRMRDVRKVASALKLDTVNGGPMDRYMRPQHEREDLPTVYVDTRETAEFVNRLRHRGALVEVKQLDIGDFIVSSDVAVERKTMDDFVKSVFDGRLFKQLVNMNSKYQRPILIIQGKREELQGISEAAFYGALASVVSDFRMPVFFASDERDLIEIIFHIARREQIEKKREVRVREGRKPMTLSETQRYIVSGIPGVSAVLAERLLEKMSTIENLFKAEEGELRKVEGIGDVMASRIRQVSTAKYIPKQAEIKELQSKGALDKWDEPTTTGEEMEIPPPPEDD
jgi:ERCC4-related helicase